MKKLTRTELETAKNHAERECTVLSCALNDILNGDVKWFGHSRQFSIGVTRPKAACGGIAVVRICGNTYADYFENYSQTELQHIANCITGENTEHNRELLQRRAAIESAQAYVSEALRAA